MAKAIVMVMFLIGGPWLIYGAVMNQNEIVSVHQLWLIRMLFGRIGARVFLVLMGMFVTIVGLVILITGIFG